MSMTRQTILASRPAAMVLALTLVAALTAPVAMLPRAQAASTPLACTEGNHNGCTELSSTPPEDTVSVPPNMVLMLDDSGSMAWDYMPDFAYLKDNSLNGLRDSAINGVYYDPTRIYTPPPQADGTLYPDSPGLTDAYNDGFTDTSGQNITNYHANYYTDQGNDYNYYDNLPTTQFNDYGAAVVECPYGYTLQDGECVRPTPPPVNPTEHYSCPRHYSGPRSHDGSEQCYRYIFHEGHYTVDWVPANDDGPRCPGGTTLESDGMCHYPVYPPVEPSYRCSHGSNYDGECKSRIYKHYFAYEVGNPYGNPASTYSRHYVGAGTSCDILYQDGGAYSWQKDNCVNEGDYTSGIAAPTQTPDGKPALAQDGTALTAGQNIANWFSYYRTRMLMAKSSLMTAFDNLDPKYRFGFASIDANGKSNIPDSEDYPSYTFDSSAGSGTGDSNNKLAVVRPFGAASDSDSQRADFWNWLVHESPSGGTPLRKSLKAVGEYYSTSQPYSSMPGDPGYTTGSTTKYACRASFTILTTDGFWNGNSPDVGNADNTASGPYTVPSGDMTGYTPAQPFSDDQSNTLADVAMKYWQTDLQTGISNEVAPSDADPATWQHMTTYTIGLGFSPENIQPDDTTVAQIKAWAQGGASITGFSWPVPSGSGGSGGSINNIADLAHAAINGHGDFFTAKSPQELADAFGEINTQIGERNVPPTPASVNASVLSVGALSFSTGYDTGKWYGSIEGVTLKTDGTTDQVLWLDGEDPAHPTLVSTLDSDFHGTGYSDRKVYTDAYDSTKPTPLSSFQFNAADATSLDATETSGLETPALSGTNDTLANRINYLLGEQVHETDGTYRTRTSILGAIIRSAPVYVQYPSGNYYDSWPTFDSITPPETADGAQSYDAFVTAEASRPGMVYIGANDGMLHAFDAPVPTCTAGDVDSDGNCTDYTFPDGANAGHEAWAFVPRAVYGNLGNLTDAANFSFRPTVDATPVTRDVFFSSDSKWHTILAGGVGLGGRGVYALDITNPTSFSASDVLWEFDSDMSGLATGCVTNDGSACRASDLGYTVSQPNIGRLADGKWVVLVPNGYFPDCSTPDTPAASAAQCASIAGDAPKDSDGKPYSALFVMNAETGKMIAELKTPTDISGVTSFGLATPVMGDYQNDQVDDVAFAGDVQGNLWRFDLTSTTASDWTVTLVYKGLADADNKQGVQPITTMPHLFPDPTTNRFMVVFGTGKFLGVGDNSNSTVQAIYGVRDDGNTYDQADLTQQYLHETQIPAGATLPDGSPNPLAGASLRCITGGANDTCDSSDPDHPSTPVNAVPSSSGGWFVNLYTTTSDGTHNDAGERVVVNPGAIFASNTVVFETLITGSQSSDPCNPSTQGAVMALSATTGGPAGVSSLGGWPIAGGRINNAHTSGSLPIVSSLGGGQAYLPGTTLAPSGTSPLSIDAPIWRRRSWNEINQNQ